MVTSSEDNGLRHMTVLDHLNIRRARPEDVDTIASFSAAMAQETEGRRLDFDRLLLGTIALIEAPARGFFMVAELEQADDRPLLGQLMVTYEWSDWRNSAFWWIQSVYVDPAWRRKGIYRRLHNTVVEMGKADTKMCGIRLYVARDNRAAQTVYRRVGLTPSMYDVYEDDFVLKHHGP